MDSETVFIHDNYRGSAKLAGKTALITGGDSGIGRAIAVHFAREGANIAIVYLNETTDAEDTRELVEHENAQCLLIQGDVGSEKFCQSAVQQCARHFGGLDILVNNAAEQTRRKNRKKFRPYNWSRLSGQISTAIFLWRKIIHPNGG